MSKERKILSSDFVNLKNKVKAEVLRRNKVGSAAGSTSVSSYGDTSYNYTEAPADGKALRGEHLRKIVEPMKAVHPDGIPEYPGYCRVDQIDTMESKVDVWATRVATDKTGTDCQGGCTGLCYGNCSGSCVGGCSGSCVGTCTGVCGGSGCGYGCSSSCYSRCADDCDWTCVVSCATNCYTRCDSGCQAKCSDNCDRDAACTRTCTGRCDFVA